MTHCGEALYLMYDDDSFSMITSDNHRNEGCICLVERLNDEQARMRIINALSICEMP